MSDNDSEVWPTGIKFVQFQKSSVLHSGIKCSPYSAIFGCDARVALTTSSLWMEVTALKETEDPLAVIPIRPDSFSQTDGVTNRIQATSDKTLAQTAFCSQSNIAAHQLKTLVTVLKSLIYPQQQHLTTMFKVLFLLENQKNKRHLTHPLHLTVLFPLTIFSEILCNHYKFQ
ncbi:KRAB-A domain-containing protein 2 [Plakobranchus ocellatus]|uniref:KRAB-A domain-containing protein 2 n=1 Tax=Plakobranchus ocellatus TaxID=259542 RepID=A0AAV4AGY9_9GAST|nr:KRAB-A domain-containing protein 2 [Plakobranchus ocellatus]